MFHQYVLYMGNNLWGLMYHDIVIYIFMEWKLYYNVYPYVINLELFCIAPGWLIFLPMANLSHLCLWRYNQ